MSLGAAHMLTQFIGAWLRFSKLLGAKLVGAVLGSSWELPSMLTVRPASLKFIICEETGIVLLIIGISDIHGFCVPGQQHICLLSPHRTSNDSSCQWSSLPHQQWHQPACRALSCAERGIVLLITRISYKHFLCVLKKQHIYVLSKGLAQILAAAERSPLCQQPE